MVLWEHLTGTYEQAFNIENQNIGDLVSSCDYVDSIEIG